MTAAAKPESSVLGYNTATEQMAGRTFLASINCSTHDTVAAVPFAVLPSGGGGQAPEVGFAVRHVQTVA
jgi:hypothetical protein